MSRLCALCACLLALPRLPARAADADADVDALVFVPRNDSYLFSRARVAPALLYAQRRLRAQFPRLRFRLHFENSDCGNAAMFALVERWCARRPDLLLGPVCEYEAAAVARLATRWDVPLVSAGALAAGFGDKRGEYAQLTRIAPSYVKMAESFGAMFARFSWRSALLVYEDDKEERGCFFALEGVYHRMADVGIRTFGFAPEESPDLDELLLGVRDSEVVIMCMGADKVREIMLAAHRRRLTDGAHAFFNVELFNASSYGNGSWRRGDQSDQEARQAFASLSTLTLLRTVKPEFENFSMEMRRSNEKAGLHDCKDCDSVNMFVEGFHDALLLYAIALNEAMKGGHSKRNGSVVTAHMWNRTFEGIAGPVSVDVNGDRNGDFSLMSMTDVEAGTYEVVANYFGVNESLELLPSFSPERFTLRGRHKENPETPDKQCGLGVSALTGVMVGAVLGAAMLVAFYFFRKNYRITIERRPRGAEADGGKHRQLREDSIRSSFSAA